MIRYDPFQTQILLLQGFQTLRLIDAQPTVLIAPAVIRLFGADQWKRFIAWWADSTKLAVTGIVLSVLLIQLAMRQCLAFNNLLVAENLGEPAWLHPLLVGEMAGLWSLYFPGLVAGVIATGSFLWAATVQEGQTAWSRLLIGLLVFLVTVQFLFLPVNYGYLFLDKTLPRVTYLGEKQPLARGQQAWLVWEGREGMTYLVSDGKDGDANARSLVTLPKKDVTKTEIIGYDRILCRLFRDKECAE